MSNDISWEPIPDTEWPFRTLNRHDHDGMAVWVNAHPIITRFGPNGFGVRFSSIPLLADCINGMMAEFKATRILSLIQVQLCQLKTNIAGNLTNLQGVAWVVVLDIPTESTPSNPYQASLFEE